MVAPRVVEERRAELPALRLEQALLERIGKIAEGAIIENIMRQKQADGSRLQRNKPSTRAKKMKDGRLYQGRVMSLIDVEKRFVKGKGKSFKSKSVDGGTAVVVEPGFGAGDNPTIRQLSYWLQSPDPKGKRHRYTGWFGLNEKARKAIKMELRRWIKDQFKRAASRFAGKRPEFRKR